MKTNITLVFVAFLLGLSLVQCGSNDDKETTQSKSNEEKALDLINDQMYRTLYDYDSYQPVETKIDSAYHTPYNDTINQKYAIYCGVLYEKLDECFEKVDNAKRMMAIWSELKDSYGRQQYIIKEALEGQSKTELNDLKK